MKSIEWSIAIFFGDASFNQQTVVAWSWVFHPAGCTQLFHRSFRFGQVPKSGAASPSVAWRSWSAWMLADSETQCGIRGRCSARCHANTCCNTSWVSGSLKEVCLSLFIGILTYIIHLYLECRNVSEILTGCQPEQKGYQQSLVSKFDIATQNKSA